MGLTHKFIFLSLFGLLLKLCFASKSGRTVLSYPYIYTRAFHTRIHRAYRCIIITINTFFFFFFFFFFF